MWSVRWGACFFALLLGGLADSAQVPFQKPSFSETQESDIRWKFDAEPSINVTSNLIFDGVSSLLQQWANTHYRNGHNIVPVTIPTGTIFYHGTFQHKIPTVPEWLATDPEHAHLFCWAITPDQGCWQLTVAASRPLNVLYFDGSSAAKVEGCLDAQDVIISEKPGPLFGERTRIDALCEWGKKYNLDGFMRMEPNFEIMLCDFSKGVEVVSFLNIIADRDYPKPPPPPPPSSLIPQRFDDTLFRLIESGQWHNYFPGETRAHLDLTRLVSFYDVDLFPSLAASRQGQERWQHRVQPISDQDRQRLLQRLDETLSGKPELGSGIDWTSLYRVIIHRYGERLEMLQYLPNSTNSTATETAQQVHQYVTSMLSPYILNGVEPQNGSVAFSWAAPVFEKCATSHTSFIHASKLPLTQSENLLLRAADEVLHEICRIVVGIWAEGTEVDLLAHSDDPRVSGLPSKWSSQINWLMAWLDWSIWVKCRPGCSFEETCYLPTWPFFNSPRPRTPPPAPPQNSTGLQPGFGWARGWGWVPDFSGASFAEQEDWVRPQPRCYRRTPPFKAPWDD